VHELSLRFHLERQTGAISRDLERGTRSVSQILNYMAFSILPILVEFSLVGGVLVTQYDPVFTLVTFGTVVVYVLVTFAITEWRMDFRHHMNRLESEANSRAMDSLINYETVKYFGNEKLEVERFDRMLGEWEHWAVKSQTSMSLLNFAQGSVIAAGVTVIMFFAAHQVTTGQMSIGDLVRRIEFDHVDFAYQPERQILRDVDFEVPAGHKVAIVGHSGAGKSTLARLLYRFYDVTGGAIRIDGQDIRQVTQESLRRAIGIVPQDTVLFNDTIYYNILYGRPDASRVRR